MPSKQGVPAAGVPSAAVQGLLVSLLCVDITWCITIREYAYVRQGLCQLCVWLGHSSLASFDLSPVLLDCLNHTQTCLHKLVVVHRPIGRCPV
jgi:hypothetical protein